VNGLEHHLAHVQPLLERYGYGAVFLAIFVEGMGIPAPGQTLLIAAALFAERGNLSLPVLLITALLGAAGGNLAGFAIGRYGGHRVLARFCAADRLHKMEDLFARRGGVVVGFGRFVDGLRQIAGIAAGSLGMSFTTFFVWNLIGAVVWVGFWGFGAYLFERDFESIAQFFHHARPVALVLALLVVVLALWWMRRTPDKSSDPAPRRSV
jgi:membrane protein DedA with SNARE-associated domain